MYGLNVFETLDVNDHKIEYTFVAHFIFSSAWLCQQSYCRGAGVRRPSVRPSVKRVFSETVKQIIAKFCGRVAIFFFFYFTVFKNFGFFNFNDFFFHFR